MNFKISKNKTLYIFRTKSDFNFVPKYFDNSPNKFITKNAIWGINILWWQFLIEDVNYSNKYIHVCLDEKLRNEYSKNIRVFMDVLKKSPSWGIFLILLHADNQWYNVVLYFPCVPLPDG